MALSHKSRYGAPLRVRRLCWCIGVCFACTDNGSKAPRRNVPAGRKE